MCGVDAGTVIILVFWAWVVVWFAGFAGNDFWVASLLVGYIIYDVVAVGGWVAFGCLSVGLCFW